MKIRKKGNFFTTLNYSYFSGQSVATLKKVTDFNEDYTDEEEDVVTKRNGENLKSLLRTAFVVTSLSFHSLLAGLTLGLESEASGVWINLAAIASHKFVIAFSVGVELVSSKVG